MFLKITIRFFLILISCVVTLLIAEFIFNKFRSANQFYQKIIAPEPHSDTESKQGFRVESEDIVYSEDKGDYFRIICLGDSFTLGFGVSDDKTYPAFLERYLKDIFQKRTQVINAGHAGSTIPEQIDFYREKCLQLEHDLVLLLFNTGDLIDLAEETLFRKSENKQKEYGPFILDKYLMGKSKIYTLIVDAIITMKNKNPAIDYYVENKAAIIDEYLKHLSNLSKIVRSKEVILVFVIYNSLKENEKIKKFCENELIRFIDICDEYTFKKKEDNILLVSHHNEMGNEFLGQVIAHKLVSSGIIPIRDLEEAGSLSKVGMRY